MLVRSISLNSALGAVTVGVVVGVACRTSLDTTLPPIPVPWIPWSSIPRSLATFLAKGLAKSLPAVPADGCNTGVGCDGAVGGGGEGGVGVEGEGGGETCEVGDSGSPDAWDE